MKSLIISLISVNFFVTGYNVFTRTKNKLRLMREKKKSLEEVNEIVVKKGKNRLKKAVEEKETENANSQISDGQDQINLNG
jgi:hypothetical protein